QGLAPGRRRPRQALPPVAEPVCQPLTPRRATWLVLRREAKRTPAEVQQLAHLRAQSADVAEAIHLVQDFATLVRHRQPTPRGPAPTRARLGAAPPRDCRRTPRGSKRGSPPPGARARWRDTLTASRC